MKQILSLTLLVLGFFGAFAQEQQLSPKASAQGNGIEISYGQPSKRGRVIFGDLVPYGDVWRAGANEATEITFKNNVTFGGKAVKAGTYTLFAIPKEKEWTIILNSKLDQWGAYDYEKNKSMNAAEVKVPVYHTDAVVEKLTYTVKADAIALEWDKTGVSIPVK
ncbi:MAG: DUF2911 domain-containing protein [Sphingobacteriales bacterium]|nr:MAG: DUF2911 domain-containing protein [Sphingobacteriales bacterium]